MSTMFSLLLWQLFAVRSVSSKLKHFHGWHRRLAMASYWPCFISLFPYFFLLPLVRYQPRIDALGEVRPRIFFPLDKSFREELLYSAQATAINACVMFFCTHLHGLLIMILHHVRLVMPVSRAEPFDQKEGRMQAGLLIPASPCHLFTRI